MVTTNNNLTVTDIISKYVNTVKKAHPTPLALFSGRADDYDDIINQYNGFLQYPKSQAKASAEQQLIAKLYATVKGEHTERWIIDVLKDYLNFFDDSILTEDEFAFIVGNYGKVIDTLMQRRSIDGWALSSHSGEPLLSDNLINLLKSNFKFSGIKKVYSPIANYGDCFAAFPGSEAWGTMYVDGLSVKDGIALAERDEEAKALTLIRLEALGITPHIDEVVKNSEDDFIIPSYLNEMNLVIIDLISGSHRMDVKKELVQMYDKLGSEGKMAIIAQDLFLTESYTRSGALAEDHAASTLSEFKMRIIKDHSLVSIRQLSKNQRPGDSNVPFLMVIDKSDTRERNHVRFGIADTTKNKGGLSWKEMDVAFNNLDVNLLLPGYYMAKREGVDVPLSLISSFCNPEAVRNNPKVVSPDMLANSFKDTDITGKLLFHVDDVLTISKNGKNDNFELVKKHRYNFVKQPSVFLSFTSAMVKVGYIENVPEDGLAVSKGIYCLSPKDGVDLKFLAAILFDKRVTPQLEALCVENSNFAVGQYFIKKVLIPDMDSAEQARYLNDVSVDAIKGLQDDVRKEYDRYQKSVHLKKHALSQTVTAFAATFNTLNLYRMRNHGSLQDGDTISRVTGRTVRDAFESLASSLSVIQNSVAGLADMEYDFGNPEWIDPEAFLEAYISKNAPGWLNFNAEITWVVGSNTAHQDIFEYGQRAFKDEKPVINAGETIKKILFSKKALTKVLDNIVSNAQSHAFTDTSRDDYRLRFSISDKGFGSVTITVENNGTPIPSDVDMSNIAEYGYSTSLNRDGHSGIGCAEIDAIMKKYLGSLKIVSKKEAEFPVGYELTFKGYDRKANMSIRY